MRRLEEKKKRLAIEAEEWKIIRQQRIVVKINKMMNFVRRAAQRDPHEEKLVGELIKVFVQSCLKFQNCNQRAHAEVTRNSGNGSGRNDSGGSSNQNRSSSRTDQPHLWIKATRKVPYSRCHHCHTSGKDMILTSTEQHRCFLTATALGLRFRNWLTNVSIAFLRMNLPVFHQQWILDCCINNAKDCGIAGYRLSKHPWFVKYCGTMLNEPKCMRNARDRVEMIDIIIVNSSAGGGGGAVLSKKGLSGSKEVQRQKMLLLPRGVDPARVGWPGLSLQG